MSEKISHEQYVELTRAKVVITAKAMLEGEISYLVGARKLDSFRHDVDLAEDDLDFRVFIAIASESDDFPLGPVREYWDSTALAKLQPELDAAESWAKQYGEQSCKNLIRRFS